MDFILVILAVIAGIVILPNLKGKIAEMEGKSMDEIQQAVEDEKSKQIESSKSYKKFLLFIGVLGVLTFVLYLAFVFR